MNYIERFYGREYLEKQKDILSKMSKPKGIPYFLVGDSESAKIRQEEFNKYLELAFRHNIIDNDLKNRLLSDKWDVFYQAHRELMCAYFIEKILNYKISFHPRGSGNSIGEYSLEYSEKESIFVEVKAPIRETPNQPWFGNDSKAIKSNVRKAREQMPKNGKNMIILAGKLKSSISQEASGIMEALYGNRIITFPLGPNGPLEDPKSAFSPSGIFHPTVNTRIGAIATLEDFIGTPYLESVLAHILSNEEVPVDDSLPMNIFRYVFKVYHNPYAKNSIDKKVFKSWPQFVLNRDTNEMEWIDNKHDLDIRKVKDLSKLFR
jgi:hypothetical protein